MIIWLDWKPLFATPLLKRNMLSLFFFFDLEKAYDTTWKYGILRDLHEFGVKGRLANFLESFLAERSFQGVPQGSILSTTLFNIKINSIMNCLDPKTDGSLYVDDFFVCATDLRVCEL